MAKAKVVDGYIRVSRVAGREGESFIAPEVQRRKIEEWARLHEVEVVRWWEELDQSGAKRARPMFQQALERCERGETGGIVVARLDRSARAPAGYRKDESGRLVRAEPAASAIAELFRRRAVGASWTELARFLEEQGVYPATGNPHWSSNGIATLIKNPVYLGQARSGRVVNDKAHEPLVTQAEWDAAQGGKTLLRSKGDSLAAKTLLKGIIRCAGCGHTLKIAGSLDKKSGSRYPTYYCTGRSTIRASVIDQYVEEQVLAALAADGGPLAQAVEASEKTEQAARSVAAAEHELDLFVTNPQLLTAIGQDKFMQGVEARQRALDEARAELAELRSQSVLASELTSGDLVAA